MSKNWQEDIEKMHEAFGHPVHHHPRQLTDAEIELRLKLIRSETNELEEALRTGNLVEAYDALVDILVVTVGTGVVAGMALQRAWDLVLASNMSKLGEDGKAIISRGEELDGEPVGKFLKGPNYWKPTEGLTQFIEDSRKADPIHASHQMVPVGIYEDGTPIDDRKQCDVCGACTCHARASVLEAPCDTSRYTES